MKLISFLLLGVICARAGEPDARLKARLLESAALAGDWLVNNQEKREVFHQPFSADYGRWLYEY